MKTLPLSTRATNCTHTWKIPLPPMHACICVWFMLYLCLRERFPLIMKLYVRSHQHGTLFICHIHLMVNAHTHTYMCTVYVTCTHTHTPISFTRNTESFCCARSFSSLLFCVIWYAFSYTHPYESFLVSIFSTVLLSFICRDAMDRNSSAITGSSHIS